MIILIGTGGHAKVVYEAMLRSGISSSDIGLRGSTNGKVSNYFRGHTVRVPEVSPEMINQKFHVAIGANKARSAIHQAAIANGAIGHNIVHPRSDVSESAELKISVFVASGAVIGPEAIIGDGSIINHNAVVDHDCQVGSFTHIAPGSVLGGNVTVGDRVLVGSSSVILPGISIGNDVTIGAGSVVTKTLTDGVTWIGSRYAGSEEI